MPSSPPARRRLWDDPRIVFPDEATWARLSPAEREEVIERLDLDLAIVDGRLRFFTNESMVPNAEELIERLQSATDQRQSALEDLERALEQSEQARVAGLVRNILAVCGMRGIDLDEAQQACIVSEADVDVLERGSERAFIVSTAAELFAAD